MSCGGGGGGGKAVAVAHFTKKHVNVVIRITMIILKFKLFLFTSKTKLIVFFLRVLFIFFNLFFLLRLNLASTKKKSSTICQKAYSSSFFIQCQLLLIYSSSTPLVYFPICFSFCAFLGFCFFSNSVLLFRQPDCPAFTSFMHDVTFPSLFLLPFLYL